MKYSEVLADLQQRCAYSKEGYLPIIAEAKEYLQKYEDGLIEMDMPEEMLSELYYLIAYCVMKAYGRPELDLDEAAEYLRKASKLQDLEKYILELWNVLGSNRKHLEGIAEIEAYIERTGGTPKTVAKAGNEILLYTDDLEKGVAYFHRAIEMDPDNVDTYWTYFTDLEEIVLQYPEYYDDAFLCLNRIIELCSKPGCTSNMNIPGRYLDLATLYKQVKDYKKALESVEKCIAMDSSKDVAWGMKGDILTLMGRYEEAIQAYRTRLGMFEKMENIKATPVANTYKAMAECYMVSGNMQGAREIYRKGQMMFGGDIQQEFAQKMQELEDVKEKTGMPGWVKIVCGMVAVVGGICVIAAIILNLIYG